LLNDLYVIYSVRMQYVIGQKQYQDVSLNYNYKWGHLYYTYNFVSSSFTRITKHNFMIYLKVKNIKKKKITINNKNK